MALSFKMIRNIGLSVMVAIIVVMGSFFLTITGRITGSLSAVLERERPKLEMADRIREQFADAKDIFIAFTREEETDITPAVLIMNEVVKQSMALKGVVEEGEKNVVAQFITRAKRFRLAIATYGEEFEIDPTGAAARDMERVAMTTAKEANESLVDMINDINTKIKVADQYVLSMSERSQRLTSVGMLMGVVAGSLAAFFMGRALSIPLRKLIVATDKASREGNFTQRVEVKGKDEIARLGMAFNKFMEGLSAMTTEREIVARIGRIISSTLEIDKVYERFAEEVRKLIPFDRISINTVRPERGTFTTAYIAGHQVPDREPGDTAPLAGSLTEGVMRSRTSEMLQTEHTRKVVARFPGLLSTFQVGLRSLIAVPLISKDEVIGVLHVQSAKPKAYTEADVKLAESIGSQIAGAIANAQLHAEQKRAEEQLQRQKDYLDALQETSLGMINRLDLNELLGAIIERAASLIGAPNGYIHLLEPGGTELEVKVGVGIHKEHIGLRQKPDQGLGGRVLQTGEPIVVDDYRSWPGRIHDVRFEAVRSAVGIPLKSGGQVMGVIGVYDSEERKFGDGEVEILSRFAALASIALDNARLYTNVQEELAERKRAEERVKGANKRLIREMREREEFLRIVSHDLGAPVRNISGMAASILRKYGESMGDDVKDRISRIGRNAEQELGLIQDLLELSRIKTRRERYEEVDLGELVRGVGDGLSYQMEEKGIAFKIAEGFPTIFCEKRRMMQVFQNLIDNACKYMDSNGDPRIDVGFEELGDWYKFFVSDNGIGIREEDQERIFYVFNRLRNPVTSQVEGKGVGLSAVKSIVENYGGEVWVESPPRGPKGAKGSTFYFTLSKKALEGRDG